MYVWENKGVENITGFLHCFKQRIIDCRWQDWHRHIETSDRFSSFRLFKTSHLKEQYVDMEMNRYVKRALTKFRFGISEIACHSYRYSAKRENDHTCRLCHKAKEDEVHFILCCPALSDLRLKLIQPKYYRDQCLFRLNLLMSTKHQKTQFNLAMHIYEALKRLRIVIL